VTLRSLSGRFGPKLIDKYKHRIPEFDDKIIAMLAGGMSTRDIQAHILDI
jgi:transposase-like protein